MSPDERARVLVVEDALVNRMLIERLLREQGHETEAVEDGLAALELLETVGSDGYDVVLLSLDLPDSQGMVTFDRAYAFAPDVPIVVLAEEPDEDEEGHGQHRRHIIRADPGETLIRPAQRMRRHDHVVQRV